MQNLTMTRSRVRWLPLAAAFGMMARWWVAPAHADLGGDAASVATDAAALQGVVHSTPMQQYDILEITSGNGMRLREFQNRSGVVFAVAWSGPVMPDLQRLLGANYSTYATSVATQNHPGLKRPLRVVTPDLVVQSEGHMRAYSGRAYLPALIPAGTSAADLR